MYIPRGSASQKAQAMLGALSRVIGRLVITDKYRGDRDWLILYGVGAPERDEARKKHLASGRHVLMWDLAYFHRQRYLRCSIDHDHPQQWFDSMGEEYGTNRWATFAVSLREDYDPSGHIILVGLGRKSRSYLHEELWEQQRLADLRQRFPNADILYRPKPGSPSVKLDCRVDADSPIENLLRGAALVSCRHSNVAVDAAVAGVPFECVDGAAMWLQGKPYTRENRLAFLHKLAWWQWLPSEAMRAWRFVQDVVQRRMALA